MRHAISVCIALSAMLTGCAASIKASSPRSVVIDSWSMKAAQEAANTECAKHKRFAKFIQEKPEFVFTYHCVE